MIVRITSSTIGLCVLMALTGSPAVAQGKAAETITVSFSDPSKPGLLKIELLETGVTVRGHEGKDVVVSINAPAPVSPTRGDKASPKGLKRLDLPLRDLKITEQKNEMRISMQGSSGGSDLFVKVPFKTSLKIRCVNNGDILVENIRGELDVENINGHVTLKRVSGTVLAHALNGDVLVTFDKVQAGKPMSFTSLNGNIDVTFPAAVNANLKMKSKFGQIFSDFDIAIEPKQIRTVKDERKQGGRYKLDLESFLNGRLNRGGPEYLLETFNGNITIRRKK